MLLLQSCYASTTLRGNLLFHDVGDRQLNQEHLTFSRKVDPSDLERFAKTLKSSATLYSDFCSTVSNMTKKTNSIDMTPIKTYIIGPEVELAQTQPECHKLGATLIEARTKKEIRDLEDLMSTKDIREVRIGAHYDKVSNTIRYDSDKEPVKNSNLFHNVYYGGSYIGKWFAANWESDSYLRSELQSYPLVYTFTEHGIKLRVLDSDGLKRQRPIICQKISQPDASVDENRLILKLVTHSCDRDLNSIRAETDSALAEIRTITQFQFNSNETEDELSNFLPKVNFRRKRDLGGLGTVSAIGTIFGGAGYILKSIIDAVTGSSRYAKKEDLVKVAHEMNTLRINQIQLQEVSAKVKSALENLETKIHSLMMATTCMYMESEIKSLNRHLQSVLGLTLLRYSTALMAAKDKKTHPYALSQEEITELSSKYFNLYRTHLDKDANNIQATVLITNQTIIFLFAIPIIQQEKLFNFYTIIPLPTFANDITHWPDTDIHNIAISKNGDRYTTLTTAELESCLDDPPVCTSNKPIFPVTNQALCVVLTYTTGTTKCPMKIEHTIPQPFLHFQGNQLFFSVPRNITAYVKCQKSTLSNEYTEKSVVLHGIGQGEYKSSCTINLPDGTSYKTPSDKVVTKLDDWPIFKLQQALPNSIDTHIDLYQTPNDLTINGQVNADDSAFDFLDDYTKIDMFNLVINTLLPIMIIAIVAGCWYYKQRKGRNTFRDHHDSMSKTEALPPQPQVWFGNDGSPILRTTHL